MQLKDTMPDKEKASFTAEKWARGKYNFTIPQMSYLYQEFTKKERRWICEQFFEMHGKFHTSIPRTRKELKQPFSCGPACICKRVQPSDQIFAWEVYSLTEIVHCIREADKVQERQWQFLYGNHATKDMKSTFQEFWIPDVAPSYHERWKPV
ncbi:hypothetical protein BT63DRAFT_461445 [Microthyrium microscopicum]|uniref:Uncharacterized protein n=1 Tax=Microthyrium microscopicum TaxID=703497 RepID=A0A6A6TV59_9PEZI|nr:hypothetical protein BT63DRAFT_461445 [Microthyrium microscopicum]